MLEQMCVNGGGGEAGVGAGVMCDMRGAVHMAEVLCKTVCARPGGACGRKYNTRWGGVQQQKGRNVADASRCVRRGQGERRDNGDRTVLDSRAVWLAKGGG